MSISTIQKRRVMEEVTRAFFAAGVKPSLMDILNEVSKYFYNYPVGIPLPMPEGYIEEGIRSDVDKFNEILAHTTLNLDVLYEASLEQVQDVMVLTTLLQTHLERLNTKRKKLVNLMDDYLLSIYNSDGYYFSMSDAFADLDLVDLGLTTCFVDTVSGLVSIPSIGSLTKSIPQDRISLTSTTATANEAPIAYVTTSPFSGAVDGLSNTAWSTEVVTTVQSDVILTMNLGITLDQIPMKVSTITFEPFGVSPVEVTVNVNVNEKFGQVRFGTDKMNFVDSARTLNSVTLTLKKHDPDDIIEEGDSIKYVYRFGAKNIELTEHVYDNKATLISNAYSLPEELFDDYVIDAVSIAVEDKKPADTAVEYYVAPDISLENPTLDDFDWQRLDPVDSDDPNAKIVINFQGADRVVKYIRPNPTSGELQQIPFDDANSDLTKRNPSPVIIEGADIWRIAPFTESFLSGSLKLEEGVNTTRIYDVPLNTDALSLGFWTDYVNGTQDANITFGRIDTGYEFFYGGTVGLAGRSIYLETFLESDIQQDLILKEFRKLDPNSKTWDLKVYLNGREIGNLPIGVDNLMIPWRFQEGLNHIAITINIPAATLDYPDPQLGVIDLFGEDDLYDFGTVKLATWDYIDIFHMRYNQTQSPYSFSILNDEIISRRQPTTNFRLKYSRATNTAPHAIRVRADLSRSVANSWVTPTIDAYRIRFLYGTEE